MVETSISSSVAVRRSKKMSSIAFNVPAAGLGPRPPSIISTTSTDEGGFNEPSPEIKAKLKPVYNYEGTQTTVPAKPDLNYVDVRHNPDGSEGESSYTEPEMYSIKNSVLMELESNEKQELLIDPPTNGSMGAMGIIGSNVLYSTIRPEVPPSNELFEAEKGYHSPQSILDPTRPVLIGYNSSSGSSASSSSSVDGRAVRRDDSIEDRKLPELPVPPSRPSLPEGPPLDVMTGDGVEYADASGGEENMQPMQQRDVKGSPLSVEPLSLPDTMTADEAERLLSSR